MIDKRALLFGGVCVACITLAAGYAVVSRADSSDVVAESRPADPALLAELTARPHLMFRDTTLGPSYGSLSVVALDALDGPRLQTSRSCERVHFAAGQGMCLAADRGMVTIYRGEVFDASYQVHHTVRVPGIPSRTRVARDGRLAALTYFVGGDSYAAAGFSTRTLLVDPTNGHVLANLEDFTVTRDGARFKAVDFNFWGVTFASQPGTFYATLASGGKKYLIAGDLPTRTARVLRDEVECPSLAPDGRRIAFKRRMPGIRLLWRIYVLDLETGVETPTAEQRSVDDQIEWLDERTILYALPNAVQQARASTDIWAAAADGSGEARLVLRGAESPAVVRPPAS